MLFLGRQEYDSNLGLGIGVHHPDCIPRPVLRYHFSLCAFLYVQSSVRNSQVCQVEQAVDSPGSGSDSDGMSGDV